MNRKTPQIHPYIIPGTLVITILALLFASFILPAFQESDVFTLGRITPIFDFGFNQLAKTPIWISISLVGLTVLVIFSYRRNPSTIMQGLEQLTNWLYSNKVRVILTGIVFTVVFFFLRNEYLNEDARWFAMKFAQDIPAVGAHVTHDEMWELYLHSRFWLYTDHYFGWSVAFSYQVLSASAGGVFIILLLYLCKTLFKEGALPAFFIILSGGYMQLYFGNVENYTLTGVLILLYLLTSLHYLNEKVSLAVPSLVLALSMTFHLLAGFLLPSLAYLYLLAFQRKRFLDILTSVMIFMGVIGGTLLFFHFNGLPIQDLYYRSFAFGHGGEVKTWVRPSLDNFLLQINLLWLLMPLNLLIIPALFHPLKSRDRVKVFMTIAAVFMMVLFFAWKSAIGLYDDWDLFANSAFILTLWTVYSLSKLDFRWKSEITIAAIAISALPTYTWIIQNHFLP